LLSRVAAACALLGVAFVVVDGRRIKPPDFGALADYLAMVTRAQVRTPMRRRFPRSSICSIRRKGRVRPMRSPIGTWPTSQ